MSLLRLFFLSWLAFQWSLSSPAEAAQSLSKTSAEASAEPADEAEPSASADKEKQAGKAEPAADKAAESGAREKPAEAASPRERNTAIHTFAPLLLFQLWNVGLERAFGEHNSLILDGYFNSQSMRIRGNAQAGGGSGSGDADASFSLRGWGLGWRFSTRRLAGWFAGPKIIGLNLDASAAGNLSGGTSSSETFKGSAQALLIGGEAGYQWLLGPGFLMELGLGAAQASVSGKGEGNITDGSGNFDFNYDGMVPLFTFNLGWAF